MCYKCTTVFLEVEENGFWRGIAAQQMHYSGRFPIRILSSESEVRKPEHAGY
jgi:hypothetical protein